MILSLAAAPAFAGDVDLSLTNDSVKGQVNFFGTNNDLQLGTGYTYREGGRDISTLISMPRAARQSATCPPQPASA